MLTRIVAYVLSFAVLWVLLRFVRSPKTRLIVLLMASYLFYASWAPWFLGLLIFSSVVNFGLGKSLRQRPTLGRLWIGISFNLLLLATFKYLPVLASTMPGRLGRLDLFRHIILPLGISFWTFEALSYLFDLYREEEVDPTLLEFCLFLAFWPTVFAGPICRLPELLPQFRSAALASLQEIGAGAQRILTGIFMMALSRVLGQGFAGHGVDAGFVLIPLQWSGLDVWCLAIGYGFQLFFDFAGYSHLVIGAAQVFGFRLPENFRTPYLSLNPSIFWTRWHMSLSFWIRDYLFLPLVMLRREVWWRHFALFLSMVIFGLWHKASWTFLVWGAYHGILLVLHRQCQQLRTRTNFALPGYIEAPFAWGFTFSAVCLSWILFHSPDLTQAFDMLKAVFSPAAYSFYELPKNLYLLVAAAAIGYFAVVVIARLLTYIAERQEQKAIVSPHALGWNLLRQDRWVWVTPLVIVLSLYAFVILHPEQSKVSPMMYQLF
jgi:alginate O-acetyltransferase complex protein AlgI